MPYEVVMATCNGVPFLDQQLQSILSQSCPPVRVLVADDRSDDGSLDLIASWQQRSMLPIELLPAVGQRLGSCRNFERLLAATRAPYVMPADQDDLWDHDKAERLLALMSQQERLHGAQTPLLVHADLRLIDATGTFLAASFYRHQALDPCRDHWLQIGLQNVVTGCACLVNRACLEKAMPFPPEAVLHDWWLALVAARSGAIAYLPQSCVSYRQHGRNVVGAVGWRRVLRRRLQQICAAGAHSRQVAESWVGPGLRQLRACLQRSDGAAAEDLQRLLPLWQASPWLRLRAALQLGLRKQGLWRTLGWYGALLWQRPYSS
jgi:hypothetical protein